MAQSLSRIGRKLGDILVDCRVVTQKQVDLALAEQRRSGKLFGETLVDLGFISEDDLGWALSNQHGAPYINLKADMVDLGAVSLLGPRLMRRHRLLPLARAGDGLTIVLADPTNTEALTEAEAATGLQVQPSIASPGRLAQVLNEVLGPDTPGEETEDDSRTDNGAASIDPASPGGQASHPLGQLVSAALDEDVREVHLEPAGQEIRVRFRRGRDLEERAPLPATTLAAIAEKLDFYRTNSGSADVPRRRFTIEQPAGVFSLCATLIPGPSGDGIILELRDEGRETPRLEDLGLSVSELDRLRQRLRFPGVILVTGADPAARFQVLMALAGAIDGSSRRVVSYGEQMSLRSRALTAFAPPDPTAPAEAIRRDLYTVNAIDTLLLDEIHPGADLDRALAAATCGRQILAPYPGPQAILTLAGLSQQCAAPVALAHGLSAIVEAGLAAGVGGGVRAGVARRATTTLASVLPITGPLRRALERRATPARIARAAAALGFRSLFELDRLEATGHTGDPGRRDLDAA